MSNVSAHNKCMTTFGQKAKFRTFCRLSAAKLRLISEKRNNSTRKYLSKANFSKKNSIPTKLDDDILN